MNEVERHIVISFKLKNQGNEEYAYLSDEEILKMNPPTPYDYINYYDNVIIRLNKQIKNCEQSINDMEKDMPKDYMLRRETLEYIKEELDEIKEIQAKIEEYTNKKNPYLEQIENEHIK